MGSSFRGAPQARTRNPSFRTAFWIPGSPLRGAPDIYGPAPLPAGVSWGPTGPTGDGSRMRRSVPTPS